MEFANNIITNLHRLKATLLASHKHPENEEGMFEMEIREYENGHKEEKFFDAVTGDCICRITFNEKGIIYYEPKKKEGRKDTSEEY